MEQHLFKSGLVQIVVFFLISVLVLQITFLVVKQFIIKKYQIMEYNTAFSIIYASFVLSMFYQMTSLIAPVTSTLKLLDDLSGVRYLIESAKHISVLVLVAMILSFTVCFLSLILSKRFHKGVKLFDEIKENKVGISIMIAIVPIVFSLLVKDSFQLIFDSFVPYPEMPNIF